MARSPAAPHGHNLPTQLTPLIGREHDVADLSHLVIGATGRLITLTGVGGCGKTRLALEIASGLVGEFKDGVWLVELASVVDPRLVPQAMAAVLGLRERSDRSLLDVLVAHLTRQQVLLVLDNCEHLLDVCAEVADALLLGCPDLRLMVTSREALHVTGERAWRVGSLAVPDAALVLRPDQLVRYSAVQLFVERAQAVQADFSVTPHGAPVVAAICARLDGLPLAIELAAAWVRALGTDQILERLDDTLGLLVGGSRSAPNRQQTMRATLDWSYGLLAEPERAVFQRLAVFVGSWSLEAAEAVCSPQVVASHTVLDQVTRLVDASLVQVTERDGRARYRLLEPVRQYAHERLVASGDLDAIRRLHAAFFLSFAEQRESHTNMGGAGRLAAHEALGQEQDNLRAALQLCLDDREAQMGLRLCRAHWNFWVVRGRFNEGRAWLTQFASLPDAKETPVLRATCLTITASLTWRQGSYAVAEKLYTEAVPLLRQSNDPWLLGNALTVAAFIARYQGDYQAAQAYQEEVVATWRSVGDRVDEAIALSNLGRIALAQAAHTTAFTQCEQSVVIAREVRDPWALSIALHNLGYVLLSRGDRVTARRLLEEGLVLRRQVGERWGLAQTLDALGRVALAQGQHAEAAARFRESIRQRHEIGDRAGLADSLESIAGFAAATARYERAVQLAGAGAGLRNAIGAPLDYADRALLDDWLVLVRQALGDDATTVAWEAGRKSSLDEAVELAVASAEAPVQRVSQPAARSPRDSASLTAREQEVASLLAHGLTNRQIATQLVVTERTVAAHIEHMLDKLGFASRHQIGTWAVERGLLG